MKEIGLVTSNYLLFIFALSSLMSLQSSLWLNLFGHSPAPYFWLSVIAYWTLYRNIYEAILIVYFSALVMITMSGIPLDMSFAVHVSLVGLLYLLKDRVLWSGPNSFMMASGFAALLLPILTFLWSHILEPRPVADFKYFEWTIRALLTSAFSLPLYYIFSWIDKITQKEPPKDNESEVL